VFLDVQNGKRKTLPKQWEISNHVVAPSRTWVRKLRRHHKLSYHDFGGVVGVQAADVKAWEAGKGKPSGSACRLMGLLAKKPYLVEFMRSPWK